MLLSMLPSVSLAHRQVFATIAKSLSDDSTSLKAVQKLLINSFGERDYSAQETWYLLLQHPCSRHPGISLSSAGTGLVLWRSDWTATAPAALDHYADTQHFNEMTLLSFVQQHSMPKELSSEPNRRRKNIVIVRPYCSPDPSGPKYEQYCQQKLMLHVPFRHQVELLAGCETYTAAYATFLQSGSVPPISTGYNSSPNTDCRTHWPQSAT